MFFILFLLHILRNLVTHGILRSTRGVEGGYALLRPAEEISLLEVIEAIEGPYRTTLEMGEGLPAISQSKLQDALSDVTRTTRKQLEAIKLSQLLKAPDIAGEVGDGQPDSAAQPERETR